MDWLTAWLEPAFMQRAALALALLAPACAAMGTQVIQARMAFFSDAIAHSAFTGVALGLVFGLNPVTTMVVFALVVAVVVIWFKSTGRLPTDTVIGVFLSAAIALGLALVSIRSQMLNFSKYLFGDVLAVTNTELVAAGALAVTALAFLAWFGNRLALAGLSPQMARAEGVPVRWLETVFALLLAGLVAAAVRFVGALLVTALLLVPAAAARQVAHTVAGSFWTAVTIGLAASMSGLFLSFQTRVPTGAGIILIAVACFAACALIGRWRRGH